MDLKNYILKQVAENKISQSEAKELLTELKGRLAKKENDIAIIGIACRFPGANNPHEYWDNIVNYKNCITGFPKSRRKDCEAFYKLPYLSQIMANTDLKEDIDFEEDIYVKGGYLSEVDKFDAGFFRIPPREAKFMDPAQRLFLETAWEAVEDAGYGGGKLNNTKTGVYVGFDHTNLSLYKYITEPDQLHVTGSWSGILATRISYIFNLRGPGMVIDTACSSGLVSVHEACQALKNKECDMAIAGGINASFVAPIEGQKSSIGMVESEDSEVKTFDRRANGTVWGEGVGVFILKPLSKAIADRDHIHAVIKGSAINNDGTSNGITAPNADAQEEVIIKAWKEAKIDPETISYIEAHGTGTVLGDPIEIKGLNNAFKKFTNKKQFCGIGSVKPSMGHLVAASGMASAIRVILSLKNKTIPPSLNFKEPNPFIDFCDSPVYVSDTLRDWPDEGWPRRAGVSSFGFSGTNCHMIFEEAVNMEYQPEDDMKPPYIFTLSARNEQVLMDYVNRFTSFMEKSEITNLGDICYTANTGRGHFSNRLALIVRDIDELKSKLAHVRENGFLNVTLKGIYYKEHKVIADNRKITDDTEISESGKKQLIREADTLIKELSSPVKQVDSILESLCDLYIKGADINWEEYYNGKKFRRTSIPVYPFERIRYWADPKTVRSEGISQRVNGKGKSHVHLGKCICDTVDSIIYASSFSVERLWVLREHKIMGNYVVPGTTYLEMVFEAGKEYFKSQSIELRDVFFLTPLVVGEDEIKEVQTVLRKEENLVTFCVSSRTAQSDRQEEEIWTKHAEGKIYNVLSGERIQLNVEEVKSRCNKRIISDYRLTEAFSIGPRWKNAKNLHVGNDEVLSLHAIPDGFESDLKWHNLHPALMDNAVNFLSQSIGEGLYLPFSYRSLTVYAPMPGTFYSFQRIKSDTHNNSNMEIITLDITLMDTDGNVFAEISDYRIKKVHNAKKKFDELSGKSNLFYEMGWVIKKISSVEENPKTGSVLVFKGSSTLAEGVISLLKRDTREIIEVSLGEEYVCLDKNKYTVKGTEDDYKRLFGEMKDRGLSQILHLVNIGEQGWAENEAGFEKSLNKSIYSLFYIAKALSANRISKKLDIILVSDYANEVFSTQKAINPHYAAFFGLGKVIGQEQLNLNIKSIDIDEHTTPEEIVLELSVAQSPYLVAYRNGSRYVEEFRSFNVSNAPAKHIDIKSDGIYVITGGTGSLGLEMGKYLASRAKINLCLLNRSQMPDRQEWDKILEVGEDRITCNKIKAVQEIESTGSKVVFSSIDISEEAEVNALFESFRKKYGRINGIVHCAGVAGDGIIARKKEEEFNNVLKPKVKGTWLLGKETENDNLDFFVLFSSIASIAGGAGLADYTSANIYMDQYAGYRDKLGKRVLAINWSAWKEVGMAVDKGVADEGIFKALSTEKAINAFDEVFNRDIKRVVIGELDYSYPLFQNINLFPFELSGEIKELADKVTRKSKQQSEAGSRIVDVKIRGREDGAVYSETEKLLAQVWGTLLEISEISIYDNFFELGGNSIISIKMETEMEKRNIKLDYSDISKFPTIEELAVFIDSRKERANG
jgi:polyketide synthase PksN